MSDKREQPMESKVTIISKSNVKKIIEKWRGGEWESEALRLRQNAGLFLFKDDAAKEVGRQIQKAVERGEVTTSVEWGLMGIMLSDGEIFGMAKFVDAFRPSIYAETCLVTLSEVLGSLCRVVTQHPKVESALRRLLSFSVFVELYSATRLDEAKLVEKLRAQSDTGLKTMLDRAELAFVRHSRASRDPTNETIEGLDREDIASGVSYAIESYNKKYGLTGAEFRPFAESDPGQLAFDSEIVLAFRLSELMGMEAKVYRQEYICHMGDNREYRILPPNERWGMALSLGYIRNVQAWSGFGADEPGIGRSFDEECRKFFEHVGGRSLGLAGTPGQERLIFALPAEAWKILADELLLVDGYYKEEMGELERACNELLTPLDELLALEVEPGLVMRDVIRLQRVFRFSGIVRMLALEAEGISEVVARNSLIGAMNEEMLWELLLSAGIGREVVQAFLDLFSWDVEKKGYFDIQYQPMMKIGKVFAFPFFILGMSNVIRNCLVLSEARVHGDSKAENPVVKILSDAFGGAQVELGREFKYEYEEDEGEIDVLVKIGNSVYAFECKHTLLPCSGFEQRTTWDYVDTAAHQLDRFKVAWGDDEFRREVGKRLGWDCDSAELSTCVVFGHRLLAGASFRGHPVRHLRELVNFVGSGVSGLSVGSDEFLIPMRRLGRLESSDFDNYLSDDSKIYSVYWNSFLAVDSVWNFEEVALKVRNYGFSPLKQLANVEGLSLSLARKILKSVDCLFAAERDLDKGRAAVMRYESYKEQAKRHVQMAVRELKRKYPMADKVRNYVFDL
ncbi:hypothetical protein OV208_17860 [Corallococcus sp. bb12-1]|uniref:hypothetical protein n=1 Tax=Corallococcus sp. bb12-1 TaxID=2996784 RepID=UPI002270D075|nr:hypothetical protein [Corallococcus sp. bb12-1]MCY1043188.1 hypothetical protein [Corallococcus sp. bb12-1]